MYRVSIELQKHERKFGKTRNSVGTRAVASHEVLLRHIASRKQKGCKSKKISVTSDYLRHANVTIELNRVPFVYWCLNMKVPKDSQSFGIPRPRIRPTRTNSQKDELQYIVLLLLLIMIINFFEGEASIYVFTLFIEPGVNRQR